MSWLGRNKKIIPEGYSEEIDTPIPYRINKKHPVYRALAVKRDRRKGRYIDWENSTSENTKWHPDGYVPPEIEE